MKQINTKAVQFATTRNVERWLEQYSSRQLTSSLLIILRLAWKKWQHQGGPVRKSFASNKEISRRKCQRVEEAEKYAIESPIWTTVHSIVHKLHTSSTGTLRCIYG